MKALFLIFHGFDKANGISKKIHYQVKALKPQRKCGNASTTPPLSNMHAAKK